MTTPGAGRPLTGADLYRAILLLALIAAVGFFFRDILRFLLLFLMAVLMALGLAAGARLPGLDRLPRVAGVLLTLSLLLGALGGLAYLLVPPLVDQIGDLLKDLPEALRNLRDRLRAERGGVPPAAPALVAELERRVAELLAALTFDPLSLVRNAVEFGRRVAGILAVLLVLLVAAVYMAAKPEPLVEGFLRLVPGGGRGRARAILEELRASLTRWLGGTAVAMVAVGAMTTLALSVLGVQFALVLGVLAGLLELVPFYGPVLAAVPAVGLALTTEGWAQALAVLGAVFVIQQVESNLLLPLVMGRAVKLHPAVIALGILFVGWVLGPLAVFIAVPILVMARVLAQNLWVEGVAKREDPPEAPPPKRILARRTGAKASPATPVRGGPRPRGDPGRRGRSRRPFSPPLTPGGTSCSPARHALRRARERDREAPISGGAPPDRRPGSPGPSGMDDGRGPSTGLPRAHRPLPKGRTEARARGLPSRARAPW